MSDLRPPEPGAGDPTVVPTGGGVAEQLPTPEPAVPPIDLSEPELSVPAAPVTVGEPVVPPQGASDQGEPPVEPVTLPAAPTVDPEDGAERGDDTAAAAPEPAAPTGGGPPWKMLLLVVAFVGVMVVAYLLGKSGGGKEPVTSATTTTTVNTAPVSTAGWVTSTDDASGFTIKHPKEWEKVDSQGDVKLLLRAGPESVLGISARDVDSSVAPGVIEQAMAEVELLENPQEFSLNGLPAAVYIYKKPVTPENQTEGVVVHYFALTKSKMYALVFVTSPPEEINRLGRTISTVAETFTSTVESPVPATSTAPTTAAATTSTTGP